MSDLTPEQEALYALSRNRPRSELSMAAQLEYDRLKPAWEQDAAKGEEAELAARHTVDRSGTTPIMRYRRGGPLVLGIVMVVPGAFLLVAAVAGLAFPSSSWAGGDSTGVGIWGAVLGLLFVCMGISLLRVGIYISGDKVTVRDNFRTHRVNASEIRAIVLQPKSHSNRGLRWLPCVELTSGKSFWIESFDCGSAKMPPIPERAATIGKIRAALGVEVDGIPAPGGSDPGGAAE